MEDILKNIITINDEGIESMTSLEDIQLIDISFDKTNPMTYIIYLEYNRKMLSESQIETITKIIEKLKYNQQMIAKNNMKKFVNQIKCDSGEHIIDITQSLNL